MADDSKWIVKFVRRRDGKKYYYRHDGCLTARMESSMLLPKDVAVQFADAITRNHKDFSAKAIVMRCKPSGSSLRAQGLALPRIVSLR